VEPKATISRHEELKSLLGAYAVGAVTADEAAALREHLATCAECQAELAEMWLALDALPLAMEPMEPPATLRDRIEAAILAEAPPLPPAQPAQEGPAAPLPAPIRRADVWWRRATPWMAAAAILLLVLIALLVWNLRLQGLIQGAAPETIALAPTDAAPGASGQVRYLPANELLIVDVKDLPPLPPGKVYEVWLIGETGPVPAGVFDQPTDSHAIVADRSQYQALAITAEPGPLGSTEPTPPILAQAAL
jgi:anti-sigma-K factor RskA